MQALISNVLSSPLCLALYFAGAFLSPYSLKFMGFNLRTIFFIPFMGLIFLNSLKLTKDRVKNLKPEYKLSCLFASYSLFVGVSLSLFTDAIPLPKQLFAWLSIFLNIAGPYFLIKNTRATWSQLNSMLVGIGLVLSSLFLIDVMHTYNFFDYIFEGLHTYQIQGTERRYFATGIPPYTRASGPYDSPISAGVAMSFLFSLSLIYIVNQKRESKNKVLLYFIACYIFIGSLLPISYSSIPVVFLVLGFSALYKFFNASALRLTRNWKLLISFFASGVFITVVMKSRLSHGFYSLYRYLFFGEVLDAGNFARRFEMVIGTFKIWMNRDWVGILFGKGIGLEYYYEKLFSKEIPYTDFGLFNTILLEVGLVGFLILLTLYIMSMLTTYKMMKKAESTEKKAILTNYLAFQLFFMFTFIGFNKYVYLFPLGILFGFRDKLEKES